MCMLLQCILILNALCNMLVVLNIYELFKKKNAARYIWAWITDK